MIRAAAVLTLAVSLGLLSACATPPDPEPVEARLRTTVVHVEGMT